MKPDDGRECVRCGECCSNSGPALHKKDFSLLKTGVIKLEDMTTFRKGELAYHPTEKKLMALSQEMIKIKGQDGSWECRFYGGSEKGCLIYADRPIECQALECWDTKKVESLFLKDLLLRRHIFPKGGAMEELIRSYEKTFPINEIKALSINEKKGKKAAELIEKDIAFREKACEALDIDRNSLDFLFGSPVADIIKRFSSLSNLLKTQQA
jgi:Fe-S-cluster containining protein